MATKRIKISQTILASFLACVLTLSFAFDSAKVLAIPDVQYYGGNDILLFDPDAVRCSASSGGGGGSTLRGGSKREKIWNYLVDKGLSPAIAATTSEGWAMISIPPCQVEAFAAPPTAPRGP